MRQRNIARLAVAAVSACALAACAALPQAPQIVEGPTPASLSTLRSHPDNKFVFVSTDTAGRNIDVFQDSSWIWAYGFLTPSGQYRIYNALDISRLSSLNSVQSTQYDPGEGTFANGTAKVTMRDGRTFVTKLSSLHLYACPTVHTCHFASDNGEAGRGLSPALQDLGFSYVGGELCVPLASMYTDDEINTYSDTLNYYSRSGTWASFLYPSPHLHGAFDPVTRSVSINPDLAGVQNAIKRRLNDLIRQRRRLAQARRRRAQQRRLRNLRVARRFERTVKVGARTNCGPVLRLRAGMAKVYSPVKDYGNEHWIALRALAPPGYGCTFLNGRYVPPGFLQ